MKIVISPAKTLDYDSPLATTKASQPDFLDDACELVDQLKTLEPHDISNLMGVSDKLGQLNAERFRRWQTPFTQDNARQAVLADFVAHALVHRDPDGFVKIALRAS